MIGFLPRVGRGRERERPRQALLEAWGRPHHVMIRENGRGRIARERKGGANVVTRLVSASAPLPSNEPPAEQ